MIMGAVFTPCNSQSLPFHPEEDGPTFPCSVLPVGGRECAKREEMSGSESNNSPPSHWWYQVTRHYHITAKTPLIQLWVVTCLFIINRSFLDSLQCRSSPSLTCVMVSGTVVDISCATQQPFVAIHHTDKMLQKLKFTACLRAHQCLSHFSQTQHPLVHARFKV